MDALTVLFAALAVLAVVVAVGATRRARVAVGSSVVATTGTTGAPPTDPAPPIVDAVAAPADAVAASGEVGDEDRLMLERLRAVTDHLELAVVVWDGAGVELYRNPVARAMFEARDGQVLVAAAVEELRDDALSGRTVRRDVELFGPPSASFVVVAGPFPSGLAGAMALVEDRSLERRTETVRRDFVANISHELKTPIGALGLLAETVRDEPDPDVVRRLADRMVAEADRVARTVDDLLELSGIEFGDDAEFEDLDARSLLGEATSRLGPAAAQARVDVRVEVPGNLVVHGDRRQLVSAVFNLVDNAVKYSPEDAEVVVSASDVGDGSVRVTVKDSGIGVPRRDLDRIFERFYRVDRARSRRTGGTGLGLAIVRHVASNHGGEVLVESTEGIGTTFTLVLPADARTAPDGPVAP